MSTVINVTLLANVPQVSATPGIVAVTVTNPTAAACTVTFGPGLVATVETGATRFTDALQAIAPDPGTGGTIATAGYTISKISPAAAITGVILAVGTFMGQSFTLVNVAIAANTATMAAAGTSHVAAGTGVVVAGLASRRFIWDTTTSLWY